MWGAEGKHIYTYKRARLGPGVEDGKHVTVRDVFVRIWELVEIWHGGAAAHRTMTLQLK